mgnify:CR=1 FL=1
MDTIKKKMMAMKNERDAANDRAESIEQNLKDTETAKNEVCDGTTVGWGKHYTICAGFPS